MSFALTALAPQLQLNAAAFATPPDPIAMFTKTGASLHDAVDEYCGNGTPFPPPKGGGYGDDGWCGTVPHHLPLPKGGGGSDDGPGCGTVPHRFPGFPPPPQPWIDLASQAQAFR